MDGWMDGLNLASTAVSDLFLTFLACLFDPSNEKTNGNLLWRNRNRVWQEGELLSSFPAAKTSQTASPSVALASLQSWCSCENPLTAPSNSAGVSHDINPVTQGKHTCKGSTLSSVFSDTI